MACWQGFADSESGVSEYELSVTLVSEVAAAPRVFTVGANEAYVQALEVLAGARERPEETTTPLDSSAQTTGGGGDSNATSAADLDEAAGVDIDLFDPDGGNATSGNTTVADVRRRLTHNAYSPPPPLPPPPRFDLPQSPPSAPPPPDNIACATAPIAVEHGKAYAMSVVAVNRVGQRSAAASITVLVDSTPPQFTASDSFSPSTQVTAHTFLPEVPRVPSGCCLALSWPRAFDREIFGVTHGLCFESEGDANVPTAASAPGEGAAPGELYTYAPVEDTDAAVGPGAVSRTLIRTPPRKASAGESYVAMGADKYQDCLRLGAATTHVLLSGPPCTMACRPPPTTEGAPWEVVNVAVPIVTRADGSRQIRLNVWAENTLEQRSETPIVLTVDGTQPRTVDLALRSPGRAARGACTAGAGAFLPAGRPLRLSWRTVANFTDQRHHVARFDVCRALIVSWEGGEVVHRPHCETLLAPSTADEPGDHDFGLLAASAWQLTVRAIADSGALGDAAVLRVHIDPTPPTLGAIRVGPPGMAESGYWGSHDHIRFYWDEAADEESGIASYTVALVLESNQTAAARCKPKTALMRTAAGAMGPWTDGLVLATSSVPYNCSTTSGAFVAGMVHGNR